MNAGNASANDVRIVAHEQMLGMNLPVELYAFIICNATNAYHRNQCNSKGQIRFACPFQFSSYVLAPVHRLTRYICA